jgi:hypothetical protein
MLHGGALTRTHCPPRKCTLIPDLPTVSLPQGIYNLHGLHFKRRLAVLRKHGHNCSHGSSSRQGEVAAGGDRRRLLIVGVGRQMQAGKEGGAEGPC